MRLLDLFCGAGGAAVGYHRAGFTDILGVDIKPQPHYPFAFVQGDALQYLEEHGHEFDTIHASPPCQRYSWCTPPIHRSHHPNSIPPLQDLLKKVGKPYVIENVAAARHLLHNPIMLCGSMFGLNIFRHRYFEISPSLFLLTPTCNHSFQPVLISGSTNRAGQPRFDYTVAQRKAAIGCSWMTNKELDQAIPPTYTHWIGQQILKELL